MASEHIHDISDQTFRDEVLDADVPVLVDFTATWCGPCRALVPYLDRLAAQFSGQARVVKLDIDKNPRAPAQYGVRGVPTLLVFKGGEVVDKLVGNPRAYKPLEQLVARNV